jgi:hypothetical protein
LGSRRYQQSGWDAKKPTPSLSVPTNERGNRHLQMAFRNVKHQLPPTSPILLVALGSASVVKQNADLRLYLQ